METFRAGLLSYVTKFRGVLPATSHFQRCSFQGHRFRPKDRVHPNKNFLLIENNSQKKKKKKFFLSDSQHFRTVQFSNGSLIVGDKSTSFEQRSQRSNSVTWNLSSVWKLVQRLSPTLWLPRLHKNSAESPALLSAGFQPVYHRGVKAVNSGALHDHVYEGRWHTCHLSIPYRWAVSHFPWATLPSDSERLTTVWNTIENRFSFTADYWFHLVPCVRKRVSEWVRERILTVWSSESN